MVHGPKDKAYLNSETTLVNINWAAQSPKGLYADVLRGLTAVAEPRRRHERKGPTKKLV